MKSKKLNLFSKSFYNQKKSIVSLNTFVLLILLYLSIFLVSYLFYSDSKDKTQINFAQKECLNSALTFRYEIIDILEYPNSSLVYINPYASDEMNISIWDNTISVSKILNEKLVQTNISSLGINFCQNYSFYESQDINIEYNGTCVSIILY